MGASGPAPASWPFAFVARPPRSARAVGAGRAAAPIEPAGAAAEAPDAAAAVPSSFVPHVPQNRWPGGFEAPQLGQPEARGDPQSPQNRWSPSNRHGYVNPMVDELINRLDRTLRREDRMALWADTNRVLTDEVAYIPL